VRNQEAQCGPAFSPSYPYVLAIETDERCGTCNETGTLPNDKTYPMMSRRMTETLFSLISDKKAAYP